MMPSMSGPDHTRTGGRRGGQLDMTPPGGYPERDSDLAATVLPYCLPVGRATPLAKPRRPGALPKQSVREDRWQPKKYPDFRGEMSLRRIQTPPDHEHELYVRVRQVAGPVC